MKRSCSWCTKVFESTMPRPRKVFCTKGCRDAEAMFVEIFSDEEINRKAHYHELTTKNNDSDDDLFLPTNSGK